MPVFNHIFYKQNKFNSDIIMNDSEEIINDSEDEPAEPAGVESGQDNEEEHQARIIEYNDNQVTESTRTKTRELLLLYELTQIDRELYEIEEEKGDLPVKINELKEEIEKLKTDISEKESRLLELNNEEQTLLKVIKDSDDRMTKFDELKYSVKSNKEYDNIMLTIDGCIKKIDESEDKIKEIKSEREIIGNKINELSESLMESEEELKESTDELDEINMEFETEENELNIKRKELIMQLAEEDRYLYEKINRSYKGEATAILRKSNCSGCYNSIPPQQAIEIRIAEKIYTCQNCGRILIDESLISEEEV